MWSRIASFVDDLNFEDDEEYDDRDSVNEEGGKSSLHHELQTTKDELNKYKDKVIRLREELREAESNAQNINRDLSTLVNSKENEIASLKKEIDTLQQEFKKEMKEETNHDVNAEANAEINSLKTQLEEKDQYYKSLLDQQTKETNTLREKLIRVETNFQQMQSDSISTTSVSPEIQNWLNSYYTAVVGLYTPINKPAKLNPPPSATSSELYLCLENLYTALNSLTDYLQTLHKQLDSESSQYQQLREEIQTAFSLSPTLSNDELIPLIRCEAAKSKEHDSLQNEIQSCQTQYLALQTEFDKEKEKFASTLSNAEYRCESLKGDIREYLRKEQEYEDQLDYLMKENQRLSEEIRGNDKLKLEISIQQLNGMVKEKEKEIESLRIQIATFQSENDQLLTERLQFRKDFDNIERMRQENEKKQRQIESLESTIQDLTGHVEVLEKEVSSTNVQLKNSQEDLNFAQLCVKNLQASLAVYTAAEKKESKQPEKEPEEMRVEEVTPPKPCTDCEQKDHQIVSLSGKVKVMDEELIKLRRLVIEEQSETQKQRDEHVLDRRVQRQLLVTYLTSVRGGAALKALMENLDLSEEEQRVCLLKEVEKYNEKASQQSGGILAWLGGIAMDEPNEAVVSIEPNASVDELWNKLFAYEQSKV